MNRLLVIGGASFDVLRLESRTVECAGGAGMYAAMAAQRCGAQTTMFGPRPDPCPEPLQPVARLLTAWLGPEVAPDDIPHFEISYRRGKTEYLTVSLGAEPLLSPAALPADLPTYDHIHVTPLGDAVKQLAFVQACRQRGAQQLSAGTGLFSVDRQPQVVRAVMEQTDIFFMNNVEATALFGSVERTVAPPGKTIYVTLGARGVCIIQGDNVTYIPAITTTEVDPTGAGETFCGATLANLLKKRHPVMAARRGVALAAEMIAQVGPAALASEDPPPEVALDERVRINDEQVARVARQISSLSEATPFPFVNSYLPPAGNPQALDFFFAATLQQFGFWSVKSGCYHRPMIAGIGGVELKGSSYLWSAYNRRVEQDPAFCSPERQASLSREELLEVFRADNGEDPMPALDLHLELAQRYGRDMLALQFTPRSVLQTALNSAQPLRTLLTSLDHIGGYKEDPLRKKSGLLALILSQRPEKFLPLRVDEQVEPVIDYHLLRSCLRVGLIDVIEQGLQDKLLNRQIVSLDEEWAVRYAAYRAIEQVAALSGKTMGAVDWFFFGARQRCPEMSEPDCWLCQVDPVCAHRKGLFQPVLRTSFY